MQGTKTTAFEKPDLLLGGIARANACGETSVWKLVTNTHSESSSCVPVHFKRVQTNLVDCPLSSAVVSMLAGIRWGGLVVGCRRCQLWTTRGHGLPGAETR